MKRGMEKYGWVILFMLAAMLTISGLAFAQQSGKKVSSYAPVVIQEDFGTIMARMKAAKPEVMKRQMDLLNERYDLSNRPARGVTMSRGKPIQEGVRAKLLQGMTWEMLAAMSPEEIQEKDLFPAGFFPLPHPNHPEGGMVFPKFHIDEASADGPIKTFPLRGIKDSPPYLHDGRLLTLEDTAEFFNLVLGLKLSGQEKRDLVAFMRQL